MTVAAISSNTTEAKSELVKYQEKLAADLAAKAAAKVITADKNNVARVQLEVQHSIQDQQLQLQSTQQAAQSQMVTGTGATGLTPSASAISGSLDATV